MWGAIIQAIDHAMGRMNEGMGSGIKVANSQGGGSAPISNPGSGAGSAAKIGEDLRNSNEGNSAQTEAAEEAKIGSNSTATGEVPSGGEQSKGGAGPLGNIGGAGGIGDIGAGAGADAGGGEGAEGVADAASSIVSDENAKSAKDVSSDKDNKEQSNKLAKLEAVRQYAANAGKGFANAGAIATGNKAASWENTDNSLAKKAAEDTVKSWRNRDFNSNTGESTKSKEGK